MKLRKIEKRVVAAAMAVGLGLSLAACADDDDSGDEASGGCSSDSAMSSSSGGEADAGDRGVDTVEPAAAINPVANVRTAQRQAAPKTALSETITFGIIPSWTDGLSMAYLWEALLEEEGYTVEIRDVSEAAPLYTGLAKGDIDMYPSAWPEVTHASYMKQYGDDIEDIGTYYDNAKLTMAVPEYVDIDSIEDLTGCADQFDGRIVGIEPGAGLTEVTRESVMPEYGLDDDYELVTSSTQAMLAELESAIDDEEDIVVTLWRPFWANNAFPVKDLEDPKGALGEPEGLHYLGRKGFAQDFPDVAEMMGKAQLDDEQYGTLEDLMVNEYGEGKEAEAAQAWIEENQDWVQNVTG